MKIFQSTPYPGISSELAPDNLLPESSADTLSAILNICLGAALFAFFANLVFSLGSYKTYFYLLLLIFVVSVAQQSFRFLPSRQLFLQLLRKSWPVWPALIVLAVPTAWLFSDAMHKQNTQNVVYFALIVFIGLWSLYNLGRQARTVFAYVLFALVIVAIIVNLAVNRSGTPVPRTGIYSNPHYLALTCLWAIAYLFYVGRTGTYQWMRIASFVFLLPAFSCWSAPAPAPPGWRWSSGGSPRSSAREVGVTCSKPCWLSSQRSLHSSCYFPCTLPNACTP